MPFLYTKIATLLTFIIVLRCFTGYLYIVIKRINPASQTPKQIRRAAVIEMRNLREYKSYLKENGVTYVEGAVYPSLMTFSEFQKAGYNVVEELYKDLDNANEAWLRGTLAGQDDQNFNCDAFHARRNAMRITHRLEELNA